MVALGRWKGVLPLAAFAVGYSLVFLLWVKTFRYTLPFLLGFLVALAVQPAVRLFRRKLGLGLGPAAALSVGLAWSLVLGGAVLVGALALREAAAFLVRSAEGGFSEFAQPISEFLNRVAGFLRQFDLAFLERHQEELLQGLQAGFDAVAACLGTAWNLAASLPAAATLAITACCASYFFARDMARLRRWARGLLPPRATRMLRGSLGRSKGRGRHVAGAYLFLYFLTFCQACVIMAVLGVPYPLLLGIATAVADVLPVLGPGMVLLPVAAYRLLTGSWFQALGIFLGWLVISAIRQVMEPKLVSSTAKIHPLASLAAVYFSLAGRSVWLLFYVLGLCGLYAMLRDAGLLPGLLPGEKEKPPAQAGSLSSGEDPPG